MTPDATKPTVRALLDSCAASTAIPAPTRPIPVHDAANSTDPVTGRPQAMLPSAARTPSTSEARAASASAAATVASAPTAVAPTSSARPVSSSTRVWRRTTTTDMKATNTA